MNLALWIVAGVLAAAAGAAGVNKLVRPKATLVATPNFEWAEGFTPLALWTIGAAEVLAAIGLILPQATGIAPFLTPLAAVGLSAVQLGAGFTHLRRHESKVLPVNVVLLAAAVFVAVGRIVS